MYHDYNAQKQFVPDERAWKRKRWYGDKIKNDTLKSKAIKLFSNSTKP